MITIRHLRLVAAGAALLIAPASAGAASRPLAASCAGPTARIANVTPRDCTIRGTVDGHHIGLGTLGVTVTWQGTLVLEQQMIDPFTGFPPSQPRFLVSAGSAIDWTLSGSDGDCGVSGSGTLEAAGLDGDLTVTGPKDGKWTYSLDVGPRPSRNSADLVMPYTATCPSGTFTQDASSSEGLLFGYNGYGPGQSPSNMITDGASFTGDIHAPSNAAWSWSLSGQVFPKDVSEHGIAFIKAREGLRLRAYEDQLHLCTIGYGHLIVPEGRCGKRASMHWTSHRAEEQLDQDLDNLIEPYVRKASIRLGMNQCEYDALTSFAYNVAHGKGGESPSWKKLMSDVSPVGWQQIVQERLPTFVYGFDAQQKKRVKLADLVKRRERELHVFMTQKCPCDGVRQ
jgi:lysozyme